MPAGPRGIVQASRQSITKKANECRGKREDEDTHSPQVGAVATAGDDLGGDTDGAAGARAGADSGGGG